MTLAARDPQRLDSVRAELSSSAGQTHTVVCVDFNDPAAVHKAVTDHIEHCGPHHILINNSGGPPGGPLVEATTAAFQLTFARHLLCSHLLAQALLPGMADAHYGRIINIISTSVKQPIPGLGVSNTIRAAVANWAKTLAGEVGPQGVTVNNVLPGFTDTGRLSEIIKNKATRIGRSVDEVRQEMIDSVPLRRLARPEETAAAVGFLASPAAGFISGINLPVDGGRTACL